MSALRDAANAYHPGSFAARSRARRQTMLYGAFPELADMRVLDLGGRPGFWLTAPVRPAHVLSVNLAEHARPADWIDTRAADACDLPPDLLTGRFDLVVSNSVIEHVGGHHRREQFAANVRAVAPHHWVQTPYRYFPVEPHWLFPGQQFLATPLKARLSRRWTHGYMHAADDAAAVSGALSIELLGITEMRHYFPDADIVPERFAGLVKSIIAKR